MDSGINIRKVNNYLDITDYLYKLSYLDSALLALQNTILFRKKDK